MDTLLKEQNDLSNTTDKQALNFEAIENTPFTLMDNGKEFHLLCGNHRITEFGHDSKEKAIEDANTLTWDRINQVIWIVCEKLTKNKE